MLGETTTSGHTFSGAARARVLLVEDDPDIRESLSEALRYEGYEVELAWHGREALARLARDPLPDVILLDLMMPVMNGWEFREAQLEDAALADIPVVVISAQAPGACAPDRYLPKPFSLGDLFAAIDELVPPRLAA
ncbi:MAG: response regulator [Anaeromyxobacter sp.]